MIKALLNFQHLQKVIQEIILRQQRLVGIILKTKETTIYSIIILQQISMKIFQ